MQRNGTDVGSSLQRPEVLGGRGKQKWWRIWKLKCPYKVKHFGGDVLTIPSPPETI
jgi:hypothetical protein